MSAAYEQELRNGKRQTGPATAFHGRAFRYWCRDVDRAEIRPTLRVSSVVVASLLAHALRTHPRECCGVLIGNREAGDTTVRAALPGANITTGDPRRSFQLDWRSILSSVRMSRRSVADIVGFYHSHPDGSSQPSAKDLMQAWRGQSYVILRVPYEGWQALSSWWVDVGGNAFVRECVVSFTDASVVPEGCGHAARDALVCTSRWKGR